MLSIKNNTIKLPVIGKTELPKIYEPKKIESGERF